MRSLNLINRQSRCMESIILHVTAMLDGITEGLAFTQRMAMKCSMLSAIMFSFVMISTTASKDLQLKFNKLENFD